jgi:hypothetical protein
MLRFTGLDSTGKKVFEKDVSSNDFSKKQMEALIASIKQLDLLSLDPNKLRKLCVISILIDTDFFAAKIAEADDVTFIKVVAFINQAIELELITHTMQAILQFFNATSYKNRVVALLNKYSAWCNKDPNLAYALCAKNNIPECPLSSAVPIVPVVFRSTIYCYKALQSNSERIIDALPANMKPPAAIKPIIIADPYQGDFQPICYVLPIPQIYDILQKVLDAKVPPSSPERVKLVRA